MNLKELEIEFGDEIVKINNQRTIFWEKYKMLILSDVHIGKTAHFRKHGIAVSDEILYNDLKRLNSLIQHYNVNQIIVVGDLFHAGHNINVDMFHQWLLKFKNISFTLISGNHDLGLIKNNNFSFKIISEKIIDDFRFVHEYDNNTQYKNICGHLHPGIFLGNNSKFKVPCFVKTSNCIFLPAFSLFTGLFTDFKYKNAVYYPFNNDFIGKL